MTHNKNDSPWNLLQSCARHVVKIGRDPLERMLSRMSHGAGPVSIYCPFIKWLVEFARSPRSGNDVSLDWNPSPSSLVLPGSNHRHVKSWIYSRSPRWSLAVKLFDVCLPGSTETIVSRKIFTMAPLPQELGFGRFARPHGKVHVQMRFEVSAQGVFEQKPRERNFRKQLGKRFASRMDAGRHRLFRGKTNCSGTNLHNGKHKQCLKCERDAADRKAKCSRRHWRKR
jgi:hypothetical protein